MNNLKNLHEVKNWEGWFLLLREYGSIILASYISIRLDNILVYLVVVCFIGARQAGIYDLNHEASHSKLFKNKKFNDFMGLIFTVVPFFHHPESYSFIQWKRMHLLHHRFLMTEGDPNFVERVLNNEVEEEVKGHQLYKKMLLAIPKTILFWINGKHDYIFPPPKSNQFEKRLHSHLKLLFLPIKNDSKFEKERRVKIFSFITLIILFTVLGIWKEIFLYWIVPMYTSYSAILKYLDFHDHRWHINSEDLELNTRSRSFGIFMKIFMNGLNRSYHKEHHLYPMVPCLRIHKTRGTSVFP